MADPPDPAPFIYAESAPRERHLSSLDELVRLCEGSPCEERRIRGATLPVDLAVPHAERVHKLVDWALDMMAQPMGALTYHESLAGETLNRLKRLVGVLWKTLVSGGPSNSVVATRIRFCSYVVDNLKALAVALNNLEALHIKPCEVGVMGQISDLAKEPIPFNQIEGSGDLDRAIRFVLESCARLRYRQLGGVVYRERKTRIRGVVYGTRSWEPAIVDAQRPVEEQTTVRSLVYSLCRKETRSDLCRVVMTRVEQVVKYLTESNDPDFPFLQRHYHLLGFRGGILDISSRESACTYIPYDVVVDHLDPDLNVGKYFDLDLKDEWLDLAAEGNWWDIPTPHFQHILDYQNNRSALGAESTRTTAHRAGRQRETLERALGDFGERAASALRDRDATAACEVVRAEAARLISRLRVPAEEKEREGKLPRDAQRWVYIFLGRLLFPLGAFDNWQVVPFVKGVAGSGKSCLIHAARAMFEPEDVGVLSSTMFERNFGLSALAFKRVWFCFEVKKHMDLPAAEFQSMISGEHLCVPVKNQTARVVKWTAPGFMVGNDTPEWRDSQGSIRRRLAPFSFDYAVAEQDSRPDLLERVLDELGALIVKVVTAYKEEALKDTRADIWARLGCYFHEQRRAMQLQSDPLVGLIWDETQFELAIRDGTPEDARSFVTPWELFESAYAARWRAMRGSGTVDHLSEDRYSPAFRDAGLTRRLERVTGADGIDRPEWVILGLRKR